MSQKKGECFSTGLSPGAHFSYRAWAPPPAAGKEYFNIRATRNTLDGSQAEGDTITFEYYKLVGNYSMELIKKEGTGYYSNIK